MNGIHFEWDNRKALTNNHKHKVTFDEAATLFLDQNATIYYDPDHSKKEDRYIIHGFSRNLRVLIVCYCYRKRDEIIRIISARKADQRETQYYFRKGKA